MARNKSESLIFFRVNEDFLNTLETVADRANQTRGAYLRAVLDDVVLRYNVLAEAVDGTVLKIPKVASLIKVWHSRPATKVIGVYVNAALKEALHVISEKMGIGPSVLVKLVLAEEWFDLDNTTWDTRAIDWLAKFVNVHTNEVIKWLLLTGRKIPEATAPYSMANSPFKARV